MLVVFIQTLLTGSESVSFLQTAVECTWVVQGHPIQGIQ